MEFFSVYPDCYSNFNGLIYSCLSLILILTRNVRWYVCCAVFSFYIVRNYSIKNNEQLSCNLPKVRVLEEVRSSSEWPRLRQFFSIWWFSENTVFAKVKLFYFLILKANLTRIIFFIGSICYNLSERRMIDLIYKRFFLELITIRLQRTDALSPAL